MSQDKENTKKKGGLLHTASSLIFGPIDQMFRGSADPDYILKHVDDDKCDAKIAELEAQRAMNPDAPVSDYQHQKNMADIQDDDWSFSMLFTHPIKFFVGLLQMNKTIAVVAIIAILMGLFGLYPH